MLDEPILDAKGFHVAKRPKKVAPLDPVDIMGHGRYLPVEVPSTNCYNERICVGLTEIHHYFSFLVLKLDHGIVEPEVHKQHETGEPKT